MKLLKEYFIIKIDKTQIKHINKNCSVRISSLFGKNYNHYFFYCPENLLNKIQKFISRLDAAKIYISSPAEIAKSQGKLFKYNVKELYLNNGKIISL